MTSNFAYRYLKMTPEHTAVAKATSTPIAVTYGVASAMTFTQGTSGSAVFLAGEIDDESIQYRFDLLTRGTVNYYGAHKSVNGKEYSEGGINLVAQPDDLMGLCLFGIYGSGPGYTIGGSDKIHNFTENTSNILPSFTIEVGREEKEHTYTGMCINRLGLNCTHGEYVTMSVDFMGKSESAVGTLDVPAFFAGYQVDGFHFADGEVKFSEAGSTGVESTKIKSISIDFNMNLDTDAACSIGDRTYIRKPEPGMREITGTVEFSDASTTSGTSIPGYDMLLTSGGKMYNGDTTDPAIKLTLTNGTQSLLIGIQKVRWEAPTANISGRDTQTLSLNFVALVDAAGTGAGASLMSQSILTLDGASSRLADGVKYDTV